MTLCTVEMPLWNCMEYSRKISISASLTTLKPLTVDHNELWKILKEMGVPDHLTCLLRNLYVGQEATLRTGHGARDWFKIGKGVHQGCISSPCLFNLYAEYTMWNAVLDEAQVESRLPREISTSSDMQMTTPYGRKWRGTKEPLDEVKEKSEKLA